MLALQAMGGDWARDLLRKVLHGGFHPPPYDVKYGFYDGLAVIDGDTLDTDAYTDTAIAAFCLAKMGDVASRHRISELLEDAEKGRPLLQKALRMLDIKE